jgi:hypothetical protein
VCKCLNYMQRLLGQPQTSTLSAQLCEECRCVTNAKVPHALCTLLRVSMCWPLGRGSQPPVFLPACACEHVSSPAVADTLPAVACFSPRAAPMSCCYFVFVAAQFSDVHELWLCVLRDICALHASSSSEQLSTVHITVQCSAFQNSAAQPSAACILYVLALVAAALSKPQANRVAHLHASAGANALRDCPRTVHYHYVWALGRYLPAPLCRVLCTSVPWSGTAICLHGRAVCDSSHEQTD